jgi:hypothetical protein
MEGGLTLSLHTAIRDLWLLFETGAKVISGKSTSYSCRWPCGALFEFLFVNSYIITGPLVKNVVRMGYESLFIRSRLLKYCKASSIRQLSIKRLCANL